MNTKFGPSRKPGVKKIADKTGFSPATVSLVLNNKGTFTEETKHAIRQAYTELSHDLAVSEGKPFVRLLIEETIAVHNDSYNGEILRAIENECRLLGFEVMLNFVRAGDEPLSWLENISGLILLGGGLITDEIVQELRGYAVPMVLVDNYTHTGDGLSVHSDHYGAGYLATEYLIRNGHTHIGFISGPAKYKPLIDRYAGYCAALRENGLTLVTDYITPNFDRKYIKGYYEMKYLLELPRRPTAVFAVSDRSAFGALQALQDAGLTPGREIELIGCDNISGDQEIKRRIPTVHIPRAEVGQMAARFLLEAMRGNELSGKVIIPGRLVLPETSEAAAGGAQDNAVTAAAGGSESGQHFS